MNKYIGGFLMLGGALAFGVMLLALALAIVDPLLGGWSACLAVLVGYAGSELVGAN